MRGMAWPTRGLVESTVDLVAVQDWVEEGCCLESISYTCCSLL